MTINVNLFFLISYRNFIEGTGTPTKCINYAPRRRDNYIRVITVLLEKFKETSKSARDTAEVNPQTQAQSMSILR